MSATTPILGIRYPVDSDNPNTLGVHTAIQHVAEDFDQYFGAWTGWTPQVDQGATTNIAKTVNVARYRLIGKFCEFEMRLTITGTGTAGAKITATLPQTSKFAGELICGFGGVNDVSATQNWGREAYIDAGSTTKMVFRSTTAGSYLGVVDMTAALANTDVISCIGFMEVA